MSTQHSKTKPQYKAKGAQVFKKPPQHIPSNEPE